MCGIVGAVARRDVVPFLLEGLRRVEYRGYDSAGLAVMRDRIDRVRTVGKVAELEALVERDRPHGSTGIAHTRWATHGRPTETNAHPHMCREEVAVVHNGIIENHSDIRAELLESGYRFDSETDTEVIGTAFIAILHKAATCSRPSGTRSLTLEGSYAFGVVASYDPHRLVAAVRGNPLVVGVGAGEHFIASDVAALIGVTRQYMVLEDGDVADVTADSVRILNRAGRPARRSVFTNTLSPTMVDRGKWRHFMIKEIHEQPQTVAAALAGRTYEDRVLEAAFGPTASEVFDRVRSVQIVACGTAYHAGLVARHWFEGLAGVQCRVEQASEFRYRDPLADSSTLVVALSQSGETADTLGALQEALTRGFGPSLGIVNVPNSSLVRAADLVLMTNAGPEIGVASTKAFTAQLVALLLLVVALGRRRRMTAETEAQIVRELDALPDWCAKALSLGPAVDELAAEFTDKRHALFLGRGVHYPVAMEGALKLKEISYIHAEAYPAGEAEARTPRPGRQGHAGGGGSPERRIAREAAFEPRGGTGPRRDPLRIRRRHGRGLGRCTGALHAFGRPHRRAGGAYDPAPASRLPRGGTEGDRYRSAPQPRQVRHRRVVHLTRRARSVAGPACAMSGAPKIASTIASRSTPHSSRGGALSAVIPPMATMGASMRQRTAARSSVVARTAPGLVTEGKKLPNAT